MDFFSRNVFNLSTNIESSVTCKVKLLFVLNADPQMSQCHYSLQLPDFLHADFFKILIVRYNV